MRTKIQETAAAIRAYSPIRAALGLILGTGLGAYAETLEKRITLTLAGLPHIPVPSTPGHAGRLVIGESEGVPVIVLQGRVHYYEGYSMEEVAYATRVLACLGIENLLVTNAAGGINPDYRPGDLMVIEDHINLMGNNPLIGASEGLSGPRFPNMGQAYDADARALAMHAAAARGISLRRGIYAGVTGPSYETPAEIRMLRTLGADAVGMSTVPEVIAAVHMGMRVLGLSCITNMASGILPQKLTHREVMETAERAAAQLVSLLQGIVPLLSGMTQ